jgi:hypothetical protein
MSAIIYDDDRAQSDEYDDTTIRAASNTPKELLIILNFIFSIYCV